MFTIEYSRNARETLKALPANTQSLILSKVEELATNPFALNNNVKKLQGRDAYRLRVGTWRVLYEIIDQTIVLYVIAIGARGGIYQ
jgi:mRNA interferase RelE/StbE